MAASPPVATISLRKRLVLVPAAIVAIASVLTMAAMVQQARQRVLAERVSSSDLADHLVRQAIASLPPGASDPLGSLDGLIRTLPDLRHVRLFVLPRQPEAMAESRLPVPSGRTVPAWFTRLLRPPPWERWREILYEGRTLGYAVIVGDPDDEIAELWDELVLIAGLLLALMTMVVGLVSWSVTRAMRPIGLLSAGLDRLEQGDFTTALPPFGIAELVHLGEKFNALAHTLARVSGDNRMLIRQLISVQETERNMLARELHDELGPCLFGIKAQAACIARPARGTPEEGHARTIIGLVDDLQQLNRRILGRLRPLVLTDLGAAAAVAQLVEDWRSRKPEVDWQFHGADPETSPDEAVALTLYRVAQECLTNAARHSGATRVAVELDSGPAETFAPGRLTWSGPAEAPVVYLAVRDDGGGLDPAARPGFGLLGIHERVRSLGGAVRIDGPPGVGLSVEALLPLMPLMPAQCGDTP